MIGIKKAEVKGQLIKGFTCFSCGAPQCFLLGRANYLHLFNLPLATTKGAEMGYCCEACGRAVTGDEVKVEEKKQIKNTKGMSAKFLKYNVGVFIAVSIFWFLKLFFQTSN